MFKLHHGQVPDSINLYCNKIVMAIHTIPDINIHYAFLDGIINSYTYNICKYVYRKIHQYNN